MINLESGTFPLIRVHTGSVPNLAWQTLFTNPYVLKPADPNAFILPIAFVFQCTGNVFGLTSTLYVRTTTQIVGFSAFMYGAAFPGNQNALYCWRNQLSPEQPCYPQNNPNEAILLMADFDEPGALIDPVNYALYYIRVNTPAIQPV